MKIELELKKDGNLYDKNNLVVYPWFTSSMFAWDEVNNNKSRLNEVLKLKEAGFTSDEIIDLLKEI